MPAEPLSASRPPQPSGSSGRLRQLLWDGPGNRTAAETIEVRASLPALCLPSAPLPSSAVPAFLPSALSCPPLLSLPLPPPPTCYPDSHHSRTTPFCSPSNSSMLTPAGSAAPPGCRAAVRHPGLKLNIPS